MSTQFDFLGLTAREASQASAKPVEPLRDPDVHLCAVDGCKAFGAFGYGPYRGIKNWFCREHLPEAQPRAAE